MNGLCQELASSSYNNIHERDEWREKEEEELNSEENMNDEHILISEPSSIEKEEVFDL